MSAQKGSNGIEDGKLNARAFLSWVASVEDFRPFIRQGMLSVSRMAKEAGLKRDVFYTNRDIRDVHLPELYRLLEDQGILQPRVANPVDMLPPPAKKSHVADARVKQIQDEAEAVKAENRELRKQLERFKGMEEVLHTTGRLPW